MSDDRAMTVADDAALLGVTLAEMIGMMQHDGMLFVIPGCSDPRCDEQERYVNGYEAMGAVPWHADDCECRFIIGPLAELEEREQ